MRTPAICIALALAFAARGGEPALRQVFQLETEEGTAAVQHDRVTMFPWTSGGVPRSFQWGKGTWDETTKHLASSERVPYLEKCDVSNNSEESGFPEIAAALPENSRLKKVFQFPSGRALVVYATWKASNEHEIYGADAWAGVVVPGAGSSKKLAESRAVDEHGSAFCDAILLDGNTVLVITDAPVGSKSHLSLHGFAIEP